MIPFRNLLFVAFALLSALARAALPAGRDTTFQTLAMDGLPNATIVLPDGKILIGGSFTMIGGTPRPGLARLNADGTLDGAFAPPIGALGPFGKPVVSALVRRPDGRFFAAGQPSFFTTGNVARTNLIRFNADGSVDPTFNANAANYLTGLTAQEDGKVLYSTFLAIANTGVWGPIRLNADGSPDASFHYANGLQKGLLAIQLLAQSDGHTLVLQGDNNPNIGGFQSLLWIKADGSFDSTFKFPFQLQDESRFAAGADGRLLVANYVAPPGDFTPQIQRLNADGTSDSNFVFLTQPNKQGLHPVPAAFLPDGGAVLVRNPTAGDLRVSFFFLTAAGKLVGSIDLANAVNDRGVVGVGTLTTRAFAMQPDSKLLFAQAFVDGTQNTFGLYRLPPPPAPAPPTITVEPETKSIGAGESLFLGVTATSGSPLTYQWQHAGTNLPTQVAQALSVAQNSKERAGDFLVLVGNAFGVVTSQVARITVRPPAAMVITQQPKGGAVKLNQNFTLMAQCSTEVATGHQWFKNGVSFPGGGGQGFGSAALNLVANDATRSGDYFVVITNDFGGAVTSTLAHLDLILPGPPQLTLQPVDQGLFSSQPVQLSVAAMGDGLLTYQWQHAGTNLKTSATIPNVTSAGLSVTGTDPNRFGDYFVVVTVNPGGSTTSRVAQVTLFPSGPPILLSQPASASLNFGQSSSLSAAFNGEAPLTIFWLHAGTNLVGFGGLPSLTFPTLDGPTTNKYNLSALPSTSGDYQFIVTNRFGGVTSLLATITVKPPTPAIFNTDLTNAIVGIGEYNLRALRQGLVVTNLSGIDTTHLLAFRVTSGLGPFRGDGFWQLALGVSNRFYVGENSGAAAASGTWGFAPGGDNYFSITNFPRVGDISRLEAYEDGRYGISLVGNNTQAQAGTYRVLGPRRPATHTFTLDVVSPNPVAYGWFKDGAPLEGNARVYVKTGALLGPPPIPGGVNERVQISLPDIQPSDVGVYYANVTNLFPNPDTTFGLPPYSVTSVTRSHAALLTVRGYTETNAPPVVGVQEMGGSSLLDEPTAVAVLNDTSLLLGVRTVSFGSSSSTADFLSALSPDGKTNWQMFGFPAQIRAVVPDGQGGAYLGGHNNDTGNWFLNRVRPSTVIAGGRTNFTATNLWALTTAGPSTNFIDTSGVQHGAEIIGMLSATDGVLVAGRFRGQTRFGATNVPFITGLYYPIGGITLTNQATALFDRTWDLYLAKYDTNGKLIWVRGYGGTNDDQLTSFTTDGVGNLYLTGSFQGQAKFGDLTIDSTKRVDSPAQTFYATDGFVAKLTSDGIPLWVKNFGGLFNSFLADTQIAAAATDPSGNVFFSATRNQTAVTLRPGIAVGAHYLARLDPTGELQWAQTLETVGNSDSSSGIGNSRLVLDADGNVTLADAFLLNKPVALGAATVTQPPAAGTLLAKFAPDGTLLWARALDEKLPFADDARTANTRLLGSSPSGELVVIGSFSGGSTSASTHSAGQRFDTFELFTTNNASVNPTDVYIVRLAPSFIPTAPLLSVLPSATTGLLQDPLTLTARATGVPAPTFQWLVNGLPLAGATNRLLRFPDLERTNRGNYSLVVSNAYGVVTSSPVAITPQLRPTMTGWTLVTSTTNYISAPVKVGADDAGNAYVLLTGYANGGLLELRRFGSDGYYVWRFNDHPNPTTTYLLSPFAPLVAPSGEVFIAGRVIIRPDPFSRSEGNFVARLNPTDGTLLWVKNLSNMGLGEFDPAVIRQLDLNGGSQVRVLVSDKTLRTFASDGTVGPKTTLSLLPGVIDEKNGRYAVDHNGGIYFYGNRIESLNLGPTNFPALGGAGTQSYVLARYDATGAYQWSHLYSGPGGGTFTPVLNVDPTGNLIVVNGFSLNNSQTFQIGTNVLNGNSYAAKVTPAGEVIWAKAWWLNARDAVVDQKGSVYLTGWFRFAPGANGGVTRHVPFGTNFVTGSSVTGHDQFVAKLNGDGREQFIRQTGGPEFSTIDSAIFYSLAVDSRGIVTTAGYTLVPHPGGGLDFGDLRYQWPNLVPFDFDHSGGDLPCYYVARLEVGVESSAAPVVRFTLPPTGSSLLQLNWPSGYHLQHRINFATGDWETLNATPPYDVDTAITSQGYFRVVP